MLVLSRQRDETIMIGDNIEITVVDIRGDKVRLGITAPTQIAVHRKEVYDAIRKENEQAACFKRDDLGPLCSGAAPKSVRPGRTARASSLASPAGSGGVKAAASSGVHPKRVEISSASSNDSTPTRTTA
ncbi:MAG: carbon storage regulator [Phycisphaera sp.]|nr:MAG: carbon storage regulator [Phycisphaera sp.]